MKKLLSILTLVVLISAFANAQDGVQLYLDMKPEKIEILPGVFELYGKQYTVNPDGSLKFVANKYALTVNKAFADSVADRLQKGEMVFLHGPFMEELVQDKCIEDYIAQREAIEKTATETADEAKKSLKAINPFKFKQRKVARQELKTARATLALEQANTIKNVSRLKKKLVQRQGKAAIYIYNWQPVPLPQQQDGQQNQNNENQNQNEGGQDGYNNVDDLLKSLEQDF